MKLISFYTISVDSTSSCLFKGFKLVGYSFSEKDSPFRYSVFLIRYSIIIAMRLHISLPIWSYHFQTWSSVPSVQIVKFSTKSPYPPCRFCYSHLFAPSHHLQALNRPRTWETTTSLAWQGKEVSLASPICRGGKCSLLKWLRYFLNADLYNLRMSINLGYYHIVIKWFCLVFRTPNGPDSPVKWPEFTKENQSYLALDVKPEEKKKYRAKEVAFWNNFIPRVIRKSKKLCSAF